MQHVDLPAECDKCLGWSGQCPGQGRILTNLPKPPSQRNKRTWRPVTSAGAVATPPASATAGTGVAVRPRWPPSAPAPGRTGPPTAPPSGRHSDAHSVEPQLGLVAHAPPPLATAASGVEDSLHTLAVPLWAVRPTATPAGAHAITCEGGGGEGCAPPETVGQP